MSEEQPKVELAIGDPRRIEGVEHGLAGVNPRSLDALMAEDVGKLTDAEFDQVIAALRKTRSVWAANEAARGEAKSAPAVSAPAGPKAPRAPKAKGTVSIDLADLFGE